MIHLNIKSDYSNLKGYGTIPEYVSRAKELGHSALALTDYTMGGIYTFVKHCKQEDVLPIIGLSVCLTDESRPEYSVGKSALIPRYKKIETPITLIAKNMMGLRNLFYISKQSFSKDNFDRVPKIPTTLLKECSEGLVCLSGGTDSDISLRLRLGDIDTAKMLVSEYKEIFGEDFYIEVVPIKTDAQYNIKDLVNLAKETSTKAVVTGEVHYLKKEDSKLQEKFMAIGANAKMSETPMTFGGLRPKFSDSERYYKTEAEIRTALTERLGDEVEDIIENLVQTTHEIADKVEGYVFEYNPHLRPPVELPQEFTSSYDYLKHLIAEGYKKKRMNDYTSEETRRISLQKQEEELEVIYANDFVDYFIVVQDYIKWAREHGYEVGVGRGCFLPHCQVSMIGGKKKPISKVKRGDYVISHDHHFRPVEMVWVYDIDEECVRVSLSNGEKIECTKDHPIFSKKRGFTGAEHLKVGEVLLGADSNEDRHNEITVTDKEYFHYKGKVYDLRVRVVHNYVVSGITVHNSVGGSELAFLLDISRTDPIRFGLMFDRFISRGRGAIYKISYNDGTEETVNIATKKTTDKGDKYIYQLEVGDKIDGKEVASLVIIDSGSAPDVDTDFETIAKTPVFEYVANKYGRENVASLGTHIPFKKKNGFRSLCQIEDDIPSVKVNRISAVIPDDKKVKMTDVMADKQSPVTLLVDTKQLEEIAYETDKIVGRQRGTGVHACGVIISSSPLTETVPIHIRQDDNMPITQWVYQDCEALGLIKMDFLGLDTLDLIKNTIKLIKQTRGVDINIEEIIYGPLDDKKTFELFGRGDTFGVFQFGQQGVRQLLRAVKPTEFEELAAITALYRPGPMGMGLHNDFAIRKNDITKRTPVHESFKNTKLEEILKDTFGAVVYQEQVMKISMLCAGFSSKDADGLRKAMGKKKLDVLVKYEVQFKEGMKENGYNQAGVNILWDGLVGFAEYAFNKSHSISYALTSYITAFLKTHYTAEYMSILIQSKFGDKDIADYLYEANRMGLTILPPSVNDSSIVLAPIKGEQNKLSYGLTCIKSISDIVVEDIYKERVKGGAYKDIVDLIGRNPTITTGAIKILASAGALDCLGVSRRTVFEKAEEIIQKAKKIKEKESSIGLFDMLEENDVYAIEVGGEDWSMSEKIKQEAIATGMYLSGNPIEKIIPRNNFNIRSQLALNSLETTLDNFNNSCIQYITFTKKIEVKKTKKGNFSIATACNLTDEAEFLLSRNVSNALSLYSAIQKSESLEEAIKMVSSPADGTDWKAIVPLPPLEPFTVYRVKFVKQGERVVIDHITPVKLSKNDKEMADVYTSIGKERIPKLIGYLKNRAQSFSPSELIDILLHDKDMNVYEVNDVFVGGSIYQECKGKLSDKPYK